MVAGAVAVLAVGVGSLAFGRNVSPRTATLVAPPPPVIATSPVPTASPVSPVSPTPAATTAQASPMPGFIHVTTTPSFAEIWQGGRRVGTTPMDLPGDPSGPHASYTLRAAGFAPHTLTLDTQSPSAVDVPLQKLAPVGAPAVRPHAKPPSRHASSDDGLVDPFSR
jgi:hypothetical protein